eukprot:Rmarinus@m.3017
MEARICLTLYLIIFLCVCLNAEFLSSGFHDLECEPLGADYVCDCTVSETQQFSFSVVDSGIFQSSNCAMEYRMAVSKECCALLGSLLSHKCADDTAVYYTTQILSFPPQLYALLQAEQYCGIRLGGNSTSKDDCGDGVVRGWEKCDDGNLVDGDGCDADCWVENDDGFSCTSVLGQRSDCFQCLGDCHDQLRESCLEEGGACGDCIEGYVADEEGQCGVLRDVYYVPVTVGGHTCTNERELIFLKDDVYTVAPGCQCDYYPVGTYLDSVFVPKANTLINIARVGISGLGDQDLRRSNCSLETVMYSPDSPLGPNSLLVVEVLPHVKIIHGVDVRVANDSFVVLFSEHMAQLDSILNNSLRRRLFDVYSGSTLMLHNLDLGEAYAEEGAHCRSMGRLLIERTYLHDATLSWDDEGIAYMCDGQSVSSYTMLSITDSVVVNNTEVGEVVSLCQVYHGSIFVTAGYLQMDNVTFLDNVGDNHILSIPKGRHDVLKRLTFKRNVSKFGALIDTPFAIRLQHFLAEDNTVFSTGVLQLWSEAVVSDFEIINNFADAIGMLFGSSSFLRGRVAYNTAINNRGAGFVNRGYLSVYDVSFEGNLVGIIGNVYSMYISNTTFFASVVDSDEAMIVNDGHLVIENCTFVIPSDTHNAAFLQSSTDVIVRDSVLPDVDLSAVATCASVASICGISAQCADLPQGGVQCTCPNLVGDPTTLCDELSEVVFVPQGVIHIYASKGEDLVSSSQFVRCMADGIGDVWWEVNNNTVPSWLTLSQYTGHFRNSGTCPDTPLDINLQASPHTVSADNRDQVARVEFVTTAQYGSDDPVKSSTYLEVYYNVEVTPSAARSVVERETPVCGDAECVVEAESEVVVYAVLRDWAGLSYRVGGTTLSVRVLQDSDRDLVVDEGANPLGLSSVAIVDRNNGTYRVTTTAPRTHFVISVEFDGQPLQGTPLAFSVTCQSGYDWDTVSKKCVKETIELPTQAIVGMVVVLLVGGALVIRAVWRGSGALLEQVFKMLVTEVMEVVWSAAGELFDILTDIAAFVSIISMDDMEVFVPYVTVFLSITMIASALFFGYMIRDVRRVLARTENAKKQAASAMFGSVDLHLHRSVFVSGFGVLDTVQEIEEALEQVRARIRRMYLELALVAVEDIPMLILGTIITESKPQSVPLAVIVSLQFSCIMLGVKLTYVRAIREGNEQFKRLEFKHRQVLQAARSVDTRNMLPRGEAEGLRTEGSNRSKKESTVSSSLLVMGTTHGRESTTAQRMEGHISPDEHRISRRTTRAMSGGQGARGSQVVKDAILSKYCVIS